MKATNKSIGDLRSTVMAKGFASGKPIYIASAKGAMLYDVEGNEYIDFGGGIAVMNIGHSNPKVVKAIQDQAEKFTHTCFMVTPYESAVKLGAKLCKIAPGKTPKRAILINSGAEAHRIAELASGLLHGRAVLLAGGASEAFDRSADADRRDHLPAGPHWC